MKVIIAAIGSGGDLNPMLAVGAGFARRGREVTVLAGDWQLDQVRAVGLDSHAVVSTAQFDRFNAHARAINRPGGAWMAFFHDVVMPAMHGVLDYVAANHAPGRTLLVGSSHALGLRHAAERHGLPLVVTRLQPQTLADETPDPERMDGFNRAFTPVLEVCRRRCGLPPIDRPFDRWMLALERAVAFFPPWFLSPDVDAAEQGRMVDFVFFDPIREPLENRALDAFLARHDAPVVFTHGTGNDAVGDFFAVAAAACADLGRPAIFLTRHRAALPEHLPEGMMQVDYYPFELLLPHAGALVHHGGIGTCAQALKAGVPQVVVPFGFDQHPNALRIERLGAGQRLGRADFTHGNVRDALARVLDDGTMAARCRALRARFADDDAIERCCDAIDEVAGLARTA